MSLDDLNVETPHPLSLRKKARINFMLHIAATGAEPLSAGSIYLFGVRRGPVWLPKARSLLNHMLQGQSDAEIERVSMRVAIEITPPCDHAQKNVSVARLVFGLLVPDSKQRSVKKADFIKKLGPFFIKTRVPQPGIHWINLSSRHLVTVDLATIERYRAFGRLRHEAHTDVQNWFAQAASRPGMFLLHPSRA